MLDVFPLKCREKHMVANLFNLILFLFETISFFWLYKLLNRFHHYEFQRNKTNLRLQYIFAVLYHALDISDNLAPSNQIYDDSISYLMVPSIFVLKFTTIIFVKSHIDIL